MCKSQEIASTGKLVLFEGAGKDFVLQQYPVRPLNPGEILVRNTYTTICGSDLHTFCGLRNELSPTVLGHEIVGEIVMIHPDHSGFDLNEKSVMPGDIITWSVFASDPQSPNTLAGMPQKGNNLFKYGHALVAADDAFHGGLAEYCILRANTAILKLPPTLPPDIAATLNCSVSTVAGAIRMAGDIKNKTVLITGMGHLGITCAAMCAEAGASHIVAGDISEQRLEKAASFGANSFINLNENPETLRQSFQNTLPGNKLDLVFDMSGSPAAIEFGLESLGIGGVAVWIGAVFNTRKIQVNAESVIRNLITIKGLHNYNYEDFKAALHFMEHNWNKYPFKEAVEREFTLEQAQEAFAFAVEHKPLRVGIRI